MQRVGGLLPKILTWENFLRAAHRAGRGKRERPATRAFFAELEQNLTNLIRRVRNRDLQVGQYARFIVRDPKRRVIYAPSFPERVLHHALMDHCEAVFERASIHDSYACRAGKGQQAAVERAIRFAARYPFFLKMDIRRFFDSIDQDILVGQLARLFRERRLLEIFGQIIGSYSTARGKGLPIGALTSQHFANSYLSPLDRFLKESLRARTYVRYMDDFVIWGASSAELKSCQHEVESFVSDHLHLDLRPTPFINRTSLGMDFLGYRVFPGYIRLTRQSKQRFSRKLRRYVEDYRRGRRTERELQQRLAALVAFPRFARSWQFRRRVLERWAGEI